MIFEARILRAMVSLPVPEARRVLRLVCKTRQPTEGQIHFARREKVINKMEARVKGLCRYPRYETLRNIEAHFRRNPPIKSAEESSEPSTRPLAARLTFDKGTFAEELLAALRQEQENAMQTAGQGLYNELGIDDPFKLPDKEAVAFMDSRENLLSQVPDEIHAAIMQSIQEGLNQGETRPELMDRVQKEFTSTGNSRAKTIAHTETAAAFNYARDKAMKEAGVTHKRWLHSQSPLIKEPRPTHLEYDGTIVPINEPFDVAGVRFMYPTDDSLGAGPEDIINCHCVAIAVEHP